MIDPENFSDGICIRIPPWHGRVILDEQGAVGLAIDLVILVIVLIFKWPV